MIRKLLTLLLLNSIYLPVFSADFVFVHSPEVSEKNIKAIQLICDQTPGVKFIGFCHDLAVVEFDIDRTIHTDNTSVFVIFKKAGITDFTIQSTVEEEQFMDACKRFQPRS